MSICLPLRRQRLRVVYDPAIAVGHFPAARPHGDHRHDPAPEAVYAFSHNETLGILDYFGPLQRVAFALMGNRDRDLVLPGPGGARPGPAERPARGME